MSAYEPGIKRNWPTVVALSGALAFWVFYTPGVETVLSALFPGADVLTYERTPMPRLLAQHLELVTVAAVLAVAIGAAAGLFVATPGGRALRGVVDRVATFGQAVPSVAIMAIAVPSLGYGSTPVLVALVLFSILPVMANVVAGLENVPADVVEAGKGMGMSGPQRLRQLEIPLALPVIMTGIKTMLVILVSAAALGAVVGAGGLGVAILSGIGSFNNAVVAHGAVPAILLALIVDRSL
ncbi:MAG TPA: ABC transporter permease [Coriobacteriia bacterium]|nr:ABC transporter permease [Coriobacteriia bacterium]